MINLIGAYVITLLLIALLVERRRTVAALNLFERLPLFGRIPLGVLLLIFALRNSGWLSDTGISPLEFAYLLLDGFSLWVHEAGHVYFKFLGKFFHYLGGTLNELIFPLGLAGFAFATKRGLLGACAVYWLGYNLIDISIYMADAQARQLPLLGADVAHHDWFNVLSMLGVLEYDRMLSIPVNIAGWADVIAGLFLIGLDSAKKQKDTKEMIRG